MQVAVPPSVGVVVTHGGLTILCNLHAGVVGVMVMSDQRRREGQVTKSLEVFYCVFSVGVGLSTCAVNSDER